MVTSFENAEKQAEEVGLSFKLGMLVLIYYQMDRTLCAGLGKGHMCTKRLPRHTKKSQTKVSTKLLVKRSARIY